MKQTIFFVLVSLVIAAANIYLWLVGRDTFYELSWIGFVLIWGNLILTWFIFYKQRTLSIVYLSSAALIEVLLAINLYWISGNLL